MIRRGAVVWPNWGSSDGSRPAKLRPVVIVSLDRFSDSRPSTLAAVVTSNTATAPRPGNAFLPDQSQAHPTADEVRPWALQPHAGLWATRATQGAYAADVAKPRSTVGAPAKDPPRDAGTEHEAPIVNEPEPPDDDEGSVQDAVVEAIVDQIARRRADLLRRLAE